MTLFEQLQNHVGGLIHIKTELYWYGGRGYDYRRRTYYDSDPGRVCLILDVIAVSDITFRPNAATSFGVYIRADDKSYATDAALALLLVDGSPQRIWMAKKDVEFINDVL